MSSRVRNLIYSGVIVALLGFVVIALLPGESVPETAAERSHRIASELRCPFCSGESIAEAQSSIGADLRSLIDEQIASGMSDDEIFDYYVGRYTDRILLSPPLFGWGLALWLLPLMMLGGGMVALTRRKRRAGAIGEIASEAIRRDATHLVARDIQELEVQHAAGEVEDAKAAWLRATYEAEAKELAEAPLLEEGPTQRPRGRVLAGTAVLVVGALALTVAVVQTVRDRTPGDTVTGGVAVPGQGRDLSTVTDAEMEEVVAANPEVIPMRLALAGRYFDKGDFSAALGHYMEVLKREPNPEALANVGWMTYLSGETQTGLQFVERALEETNELPQPYWYLANIRFWGLDDAVGAVEPLETLLTFDSLPAEVRTAASDLLDEVRAAL